MQCVLCFLSLLISTAVQVSFSLIVVDSRDFFQLRSPHFNNVHHDSGPLGYRRGDFGKVRTELPTSACGFAGLRLRSLRRHWKRLVQLTSPFRGFSLHKYQTGTGPWIENVAVQSMLDLPWPRIVAEQWCREPNAVPFFPILVESTDILAHPRLSAFPEAALAFRSLLNAWMCDTAVESSGKAEIERLEEEDLSCIRRFTLSEKTNQQQQQQQQMPGMYLEREWIFTNEGLSFSLENSPIPYDQSFAGRPDFGEERLFANLTYAIISQHDKALLPFTNYTWRTTRIRSEKSTATSLSRIVVFGAGGWGHVPIPLLYDLPQLPVNAAGSAAPFRPLRRHLLSFQGRLVQTRADDTLRGGAGGSLLSEPPTRSVGDAPPPPREGPSGGRLWLTDYSSLRLGMITHLVRAGFNTTTHLGLLPPGKDVGRARSLTQESAFALAPRGYGATSFRLGEAAHTGRVPILICGSAASREAADLVDGLARLEVLLGTTRKEMAENGTWRQEQLREASLPWLPYHGRDPSASMEGGRRQWISLIPTTNSDATKAPISQPQSSEGDAFGFFTTFEELSLEGQDGGIPPLSGTDTSFSLLSRLGSLLKEDAARNAAPGGTQEPLSPCTACILAQCTWDARIPTLEISPAVVQACGSGCLDSVYTAETAEERAGFMEASKSFGIAHPQGEEAPVAICVHPHSQLARLESFLQRKARSHFSLRGVLHRILETLLPDYEWGGTLEEERHPPLVMQTPPPPFLQRPGAFLIPPDLASTLLPSLLTDPS